MMVCLIIATPAILVCLFHNFILFSNAESSTELNFRQNNNPKTPPRFNPTHVVKYHTQNANSPLKKRNFLQTPPEEDEKKSHVGRFVERHLQHRVLRGGSHLLSHPHRLRHSHDLLLAYHPQLRLPHRCCHAVHALRLLRHLGVRVTRLLWHIRHYNAIQVALRILLLHHPGLQDTGSFLQNHGIHLKGKNCVQRDPELHLKLLSLLLRHPGRVTRLALPFRNPGLRAAKRPPLQLLRLVSVLGQRDRTYMFTFSPYVYLSTHVLFPSLATIPHKSRDQLDFVRRQLSLSKQVPQIIRMSLNSKGGKQSRALESDGQTNGKDRQNSSLIYLGHSKENKLERTVFDVPRRRPSHEKQRSRRQAIESPEVIREADNPVLQRTRDREEREFTLSRVHDHSGEISAGSHFEKMDRDAGDGFRDLGLHGESLLLDAVQDMEKLEKKLGGNPPLRTGKSENTKTVFNNNNKEKKSSKQESDSERAQDDMNKKDFKQENAGISGGSIIDNNNLEMKDDLPFYVDASRSALPFNFLPRHREEVPFTGLLQQKNVSLLTENKGIVRKDKKSRLGETSSLMHNHLMGSDGHSSELIDSADSLENYGQMDDLIGKIRGGYTHQESDNIERNGMDVMQSGIYDRLPNHRTSQNEFPDKKNGDGENSQEDASVTKDFTKINDLKHKNHKKQLHGSEDTNSDRTGRLKLALASSFPHNYGPGHQSINEEREKTKLALKDVSSGKESHDKSSGSDKNYEDKNGVSGEHIQEDKVNAKQHDGKQKKLHTNKPNDNFGAYTGRRPNDDINRILYNEYLKAYRKLKMLENSRLNAQTTGSKPTVDTIIADKGIMKGPLFPFLDRSSTGFILPQQKPPLPFRLGKGYFAGRESIDVTNNRPHQKVKSRGRFPGRNKLRVVVAENRSMFGFGMKGPVRSYGLSEVGAEVKEQKELIGKKPGQSRKYLPHRGRYAHNGSVLASMSGNTDNSNNDGHIGYGGNKDGGHDISPSDVIVSSNKNETADNDVSENTATANDTAMVKVDNRPFPGWARLLRDRTDVIIAGSAVIGMSLLVLAGAILTALARTFRGPGGDKSNNQTYRHLGLPEERLKLKDSNFSLFIDSSDDDD